MDYIIIKLPRLNEAIQPFRLLSTRRPLATDALRALTCSCVQASPSFEINLLSDYFLTFILGFLLPT